MYNSYTFALYTTLPAADADALVLKILRTGFWRIMSPYSVSDS